MASTVVSTVANTPSARPVLKVPAQQAPVGSNHGAAAEAAVPSALTLPGVAPLAGASADAAKPVVPMSATWACSTATIDAKGQLGGPVTDPLTVGQLFVVSCEGASAPLQVDKIFLIAPKENQYALKLMQVRETSANKVSFLATTYVASEKGPLPISGFILTDGKTAVAIAPLQLQSHTVIAQDKNPERKPFGPWGPMSVSYPLWLWLTVALLAAAFAMAIAYILFRRIERRKFVAELNRETSVLSPYNQFNKELRGLGRLGAVTEASPWTAARAKEMLITLQAALQWYIAREFEIPAHKIPLQRSLEQLATLRTRHLGARFQADEREIATALRELQRALEHPSTVSLGEIQQLTELCRQSVERLNKWPFTRGSTKRAKKPTAEVLP